jgi:hypothetical protein
MRKYIFLGVAALLLSKFAVVTTAQEPDWQIHSKWCVSDGGSSGRVYRNTCVNHDQFDSVVACQLDSGGGDYNYGPVRSVQAAGRQAVNQYMDNYKPSTCK